ncbi:MAG: response regulator [Deltaproteobacteria bacterium]
MTSAAPGGWVLVVDDDRSLARAVSQVLAQWVPCQVAMSPREARALHAARPGLVGALVDLYLSDCDGLLHVAQPLRALEPGLDIRIFTGLGPEDPAVQRVVDAGFWYVLKDEAREQLRTLGPVWGRSAELVASSFEHPASAARPVLATPSPELDEPLVEGRIATLRAAGVLTARQLDILVLQARGLSHTEVARALGISSKAVEHHSNEARRRTGKSLFEHAHDVVAGTTRTLRRMRE